MVSCRNLIGQNRRPTLIFRKWLRTGATVSLLWVIWAPMWAQTVIDWIGGTDNWNDSANWSPGQVPDNNGTIYEVRIDNGDGGTASVVTLDLSVDILSLTVDAGDRLNVQQSISLTIDDTVGSGFISNAGTVALSGLTNTTQLLIKGDVTLDGGGTVELADSANNFLQGASGTNSLINEDNLIQGAGFLGNNNLQIINRGTVEANGTSKLTLDPPTAGFVNKGTMRAVGGSTLRINPGTVTNTESAVDGTIRANAATLELSGATISGGIVDIVGAGTITLSSSSTIFGGTVTNTATGLIRATASSNRLSGAVTNPSGGSIRIDNAATLIFDGSGTYSSAGTILIDGNTNTTQLLIDGDATIGGGGTLELSDSVNNLLQGFSAPDSLINEDLTIQGAGRIGNNSLQLINRGVIEANGTNALILDPPTAGFVNKGTIRAVNGATLRIDPGTVTNTESSVDGTIRADAGTLELFGATISGGMVDIVGAGTITLSSPSTISGGTVMNTATGLIRAIAGSNRLSGAVTNPSGGNIQIDNAVTLIFDGSGTYSNADTILINGSTNTTQLLIDGDATINGGGTIELGDSVNNFLQGFSAPDSLINEDLTIQGAGRIGNNSLQLINRGVVEANGTNALILDPPTAGFVNKGIIRAVGGSTLRIDPGTVTNTESSVDGTIRADASTLELSGATISGGMVDIVGAGTITLSSSSTISGGTVMNTATGLIRAISGSNRLSGAVTNPSGGTIQVDNGVTLIFDGSGTYSNAGTILIDGTTTTQLQIDGDASISGGGTIELSDSVNNFLQGFSAPDSLINEDLTIKGAGNIGNNSLQLINRGTVEANGSNLLTLDPPTAGFVNKGMIRAVGGSTLKILNGTVTNMESSVDGTIEAIDNSTVQLSGAIVDGGIIRTSNGGQIAVIGSSTLRNLPASLEADVQVSNGITLTLVGPIHNTGNIDVNSTGSSTSLSINDGDVTLTGGGSINFTDNVNNRVTGNNPANRLINEDNTIQGAGLLGVNAIGIINRSLIDANATAALTIDPSTTAGAVNSATMSATNGSTLVLAAGTYTNFEGSTDGLIRADASTVQLSNAIISGGIVDIVGAGTITLSSSSTISGGTVMNSGTGLIRSTSSGNRLSGAVTNPFGGNIQIDNGATLIFDGSGTYSNAGTILIDGTTTTQLQIDGDATISGGGTIELSDSVNNFLQGLSAPDSLINEDLTIKGAGNIGNNTLQLINGGVVEANGTNKLTLDPPSAGFVNKDIMRAVGGSTLRIQNGTVTNTESSVDGTIRANAGTLELSAATISGGIVDIVGAGTITLSSSTISGGTVMNTATGLIRSTSGSNRLSGAVTNPFGGNIQIDNGATLIFDGSGTYSNAGTILIDGTTTTQLQIDGDATISGGGTIELSDSVNNFLQGLSAPDSLINEDLTIKGAGNIGNNSLQLINGGVVEANGTNKLTLDPPSAGFVNKGTMRAVGGSTLRIQNGTVTNAESSVDGTIRANAGTLELSGATISGGIVDIVGAGTITLSSSTISGGTVANSATGTIQTTSGTSILGGSVTNPDGGQIRVLNNTTLTLQSSGTYQNAGELSLEATANSTLLRVSGGDVSLSGGGTVTLSDSVNNLIQGTVSTDRLINVDQTIKGSGNIGGNTMGLTNQETIIANQPTLLIIDPSSSTDVTNTGVLRADGGTLRLTGGDFINTDGTIEAVNGSTVELSTAVVEGGTLQTSSGGLIEVISNSTLKNLPASLEADLQVNNNVVLTLVGPIHNTGTINVNAVANSTGLNINDGDVTLTGQGQVNFSDSVNNFVSGNNAANRLINEDNTIQGAGALGSNLIGIINRSLIDANVGSSLTVDPSSTSGAVNSGTIKASNGGSLVLAGGTYTNFEGITDRLIQANASNVQLNSATVNGGEVEILGAGTLGLASSSISGGTVANSATGTIQTTSGTSTLGGMVSNPAGGQIRVLNLTTLTLQSTGTYQNAGELSLEGGANSTVLKVSGGDVSLSGGGTVTLSDSVNNLIQGTTSTDRLINVDQTIEGSGNIGGNLMGLTNQGTIIADQPTLLIIDPSSSTDVTNTGVLRADGGTLRLSAGAFNNTGGTIEAVNGSTVQLSSAIVEGGTIQTSTGGLIEVISSSTLKNMPTSLDADLQVNNLVTLTLVGAIHNTGTINVNATANSTGLRMNDGDVTLTGGGMIFFSDSLNNFVTGNSSSNSLINEDNAIEGAGFLGSNIIQLINRGSISATGDNALTIDLSSSTTNEGTFAALGSGGLSFADAFTNQASVVVDNGSQFLVTGNFTQTGGFTLADGLIDPTGIFDLVDGGLGGSGSIAANVTSGGLIAPGDSAGTLAVLGNLTMTSAAALAFEIGGLSQGSEYDFLSVSATASLDGDLEFSFFNGGQNLIGDTDALEVLGATTIVGSFFNVASGDRLIAIDGKGSFIVNYGSGSPFNPGSVILSNFMLIPEPRVYGMILAFAVSVVVATRRRSVRAGK